MLEQDHSDREIVITQENATTVQAETAKLREDTIR